MKLVPLGDRVVLKQLVAEETTKSGIVLPGQNKEKPQQRHRQIFITNFLLGDFTLYFLFNIHYIML